MIRAVLTAMAFIAPALAAAQLPSPLPEVTTDPAKVEKFSPRPLTFPNGVRGIPGVPYWVPAVYRPLKLDLYLPPSSMKRPEAGFPLVIYIHGGGWMSGNAHRHVPFVDFPEVLASLAARGYVVASVEYRLSNEAKFPAQIQDVKAAIRWLRFNASKYDIDPKHTVAWGMSAGGHLAGLAAVSCNVAALEPKQTGHLYASGAKDNPGTLLNISDCVQGSVSWYGVFDMATITAQARQDKAMSRDVSTAPEWKLLGCFANKCKAEQIAAASPVTYVDEKDPPMLLIVGAEDMTVPHQQTLEMAEKLKSVGVQHELIVLPGVGHCFIGKTLEETREANLKALAATFRFIDQTIGTPAPPRGPNKPKQAPGPAGARTMKTEQAARETASPIHHWQR